MLYVHQLMGDGAPGEVNPAALGPAVQSTFRRVARDSARYAGPVPARDEPAVGRDVAAGAPPDDADRARASPRRARPCPNVRLDLASRRRRRAAQERAHGRRRRRADRAHADRRPQRRAGHDPLRARRRAEPGDLRAAPRRRRAQRPAPRRAGDDARRARTSRSASRPRRSPSARRRRPRRWRSARPSRDTVSISGAFAGWRADVEVRLYGPARTREAIDCTGEPAATTTYSGRRSGRRRRRRSCRRGPAGTAISSSSPAATTSTGLTTPCGEASELVKVEAQPTRQDAGQRAGGRSRRRRHRHRAPCRAWAARRSRSLATLHGPYAVGGQDHLRGRRRSGAGSFAAAGRRLVRDRAGHADRARLLHLPRVDRGERVRAGGADAVRRGGRDDDRARPPADHDAGQRAGDGAGRDDHRQRRRQRARRAERDGERRAVGAVPDARGDPLRRHAAGDLDARRPPATGRTRARRRRSTGPATTATASRSPRRPRTRAPRPPAARSPRRRSRAPRRR